jgi:rubrerythrin
MPETHAPSARDDDATPTIGRRLLGAGLAGLAASVLPGLAGRTFAQTSDTTGGSSDTTGDTTGGTGPTQGSTPREGEDTGGSNEGGTVGATVVPTGPTPDETDTSTTTELAATTTEPARRPTEADEELLGFMQQVEAAVVRLYDTALAGNALDDTSRAVFSAIRESHQGYGQAAGALLGQAAPKAAEAELPELGDLDVGATSVSAVAEAALRAEAIALATHRDTVGQLEGTDGARLVASIAVMEARHCTVLAELAGRRGLDALELPDVETIAG